MRVIPLSQITISPSRQRQVFEGKSLQDLADSIAVNGLFHPPVIRETPEGFVLVAGERRLKAITSLHEFEVPFSFDGEVIPPGYVPVSTLGELSILAAEEAELDENLKRKDLTWQEHAAALERLKKLRDAQAGLKGETFSVQDLSVEVGGYANGYFGNTVRKELIVAKHLDNPEVSKAKTVDEAFKILKKQETVAKNVELAAAFGKEKLSDSFKLYNQESIAFMHEYIGTGSEKFDVILTDPPYGMDAHKFDNGGGKQTGITHIYDDSYESWKSLMTAFSSLSFQITKPQAHAYIFCDFDRFHELKGMMLAAGWYVFRTPFVTYKQNSGRVPLPESGPRRQYELLLYAIKGKKPVTQIYPDVIATDADENLTHGAQKPVALFENLLKRSVKPGDLVGDFFAGTGPIFPAAFTHSCQAIGVEMNPEYYAIALQRIQELEKAPTLF